MKNIKTKLVIVLFVILFGSSLLTEPPKDIIDTIGGATNTTFNSTIDDVTGASEDDD